MGKAIHLALEEKAKAWALRELKLESTALARPFYERLGYRSAGAAKLRFGVLHSYPYEKTLQPNGSNCVNRDPRRLLPLSPCLRG